ncbi:DUF4062 domain-containing protein [Bifidobacterium vansinderenii]|uniref:NACHT domain-containing protein n=1 Tax=Bifidobacterium vansinderenii TaxID=1984871 RepID=A0A229VX64_9BIFI|nr:DUF4062 domain-containing protein [Bifidobacterium vansinderenii]OXN00219.1 NACHT domain-containing protein [Bifidobacterium vansinderenii]
MRSTSESSTRATWPWQPPAPVSIFVSSTFRDMQNERDALRDLALPRLRAFAAEYGTSVDMVDLRWGVDTNDMPEDEQERKVLHSCMQEIDRCSPFFLSLLGDRYGYVLGGAAERELRNAYPSLPTGRSLTELEILHALDHGDVTGQTTLFYIRSIANVSSLDESRRNDFVSMGDDAARLGRLKELIHRRFPESLQRYDVTINENGTYDLSDFVEMVVSDVMERLTNLWGPKPHTSFKDLDESSFLTAVRQTMSMQQSFAKQQTMLFAGRGQLVDNVLYFCEHSDHRALIVHGESGSGKTALVAKVSSQLRAQYPDRCVITIFCGRTDITSSFAGMLRYCSQLLFDHAHAVGLIGAMPTISKDLTEGSAEAERWKFSYLLQVVCADKPVILLVDGVDQLTSNHVFSPLDWLPGNLPHNCRVICTTASQNEKDIYRDLPRIDGVTMVMPPLTGDDIQAMIMSIAANAHKEIPSAVLDLLMRMINHGALHPNALYIRLTIWNMLTLSQADYAKADAAMRDDGLSPISALTIQLLDRLGHQPLNITDLFLELVDKAVHTVDGDVRDHHVLLWLIALSGHGLRDDDLRELMRMLHAQGIVRNGFNIAELSWMRQLVPDMFIHRTYGEWDLSHVSLRKMLISPLPSLLRVTLLNALADHFMNRIQHSDYDLVAARDLIPLLWEIGRIDDIFTVLSYRDRYPIIRALVSEEAAREHPEHVEDSVLYRLFAACQREQDALALFNLDSNNLHDLGHALRSSHSYPYIKALMDRLQLSLQTMAPRAVLQMRVVMYGKQAYYATDDDEKLRLVRKGLALADTDVTNTDFATVNLRRLAGNIEARRGNITTALRYYDDNVDLWMAAYDENHTIQCFLSACRAFEDAMGCRLRANPPRIQETKECLVRMYDLLATVGQNNMNPDVLNGMCIYYGLYSWCCEVAGYLIPPRDQNSDMMFLDVFWELVTRYPDYDVSYLAPYFVRMFNRLSSYKEGLAFLHSNETITTTLLSDITRMFGEAVHIAPDTQSDNTDDAAQRPVNASEQTHSSHQSQGKDNTMTTQDAQQNPMRDFVAQVLDAMNIPNLTGEARDIIIDERVRQLADNIDNAMLRALSSSQLDMLDALLDDPNTTDARIQQFWRDSGIDGQQIAMQEMMRFRKRHLGF